MPRVKDRVRSEDVTLDEDLTFADLQLPVRAAPNLLLPPTAAPTNLNLTTPSPSHPPNRRPSSGV